MKVFKVRQNLSPFLITWKIGHFDWFAATIESWRVPQNLSPFSITFLITKIDLEDVSEKKKFKFASLRRPLAFLARNKGVIIQIFFQT